MITNRSSVTSSDVTWRILIMFAAMVPSGCHRRETALEIPSPKVSWEETPSSNSPQAIRKAYRIENRGDRDLVLGPIRTTCGCTGATVEPSTVPPNSHAVVKIEGRPPSVGRKSVNVFIPTNDPRMRELHFVLEMGSDVTPPYVMNKPIEISFGTIRKDILPEPRHLTIDVLEDRSNSPLVGAVATDNDLIDVKGGYSEDLPDPDTRLVLRRYRYSVSLTRLPGSGGFKGEISVLAGRDAGNRFALLKVPVYGFSREVIHYIPSTFRVNLTNSREAARKTLTFLCDDPGFAMKIDCLSGRPDLMVTPLRQSDSRCAFEIVVSPSISTNDAMSLDFRTNHREYPLITIPISIRSANAENGFRP